MRNIEELKDLREQGRNLIERKRDEFVRNSLLSDEFLEMLEKNKKPMDLLMSYYKCAIMEIETKFKVLNQEYSLQYDKNPIESIKTRVKSYDSLLRKIRRKDIPLTLESIEKNINDIAGVRVICSFPDDIYEIAESFLNQDDITLLEKKDYIKNPKESGYKSYHMLVSVPIFLSDSVVDTKVEIQIRTIAMDFWASLEHKIYYKFEGDAPDYISRDLRECAEMVSTLDEKMLSLNEAIQECLEKQEELNMSTKTKESNREDQRVLQGLD
jgi:putative GTP pyrophosphokinase